MLRSYEVSLLNNKKKMAFFPPFVKNMCLFQNREGKKSLETISYIILHKESLSHIPLQTPAGP